MSDTEPCYPHPRLGHALLEDQMCTYTGQGMEVSPDVLDATVYGLTELMLDPTSSADDRIAALQDRAKRANQPQPVVQPAPVQSSSQVRIPL